MAVMRGRPKKRWMHSVKKYKIKKRVRDEWKGVT